ncbi:MAG: hypothetical protein F6J93_38535 [Oscillatoria sp. SIO1A7]|nr:hypothetical protein [Oscillatoria sp. SIO1A7]
MLISFDLDDTLICDRELVPKERNKVPFFLKPWLNEPLRLGTCKLMQQLNQYGCGILIITSSYRSPWLVRLWLTCYGISVVNVINQNIYRDYLKRHSINLYPSKNPKLFGSSLHIDDSEGVRLEGEKYGFEVIVISPTDRNWTEKVIEAVRNKLKAGKI